MCKISGLSVRFMLSLSFIFLSLENQTNEEILLQNCLMFRINFPIAQRLLNCTISDNKTPRSTPQFRNPKKLVSPGNRKYNQRYQM